MIIIRLALFHTGRAPEGTDFMLVHFLAIVTVVFFTGQKALADDRETSFPILVRQGLRNASLYALLIGIFLYIFYTRIDTQEFPVKIEERLDLVVQQGGDEEKERERLETMFNPFNYASITFFALLAVGAFNALFLAVIHHKLLRNFRR